MSQYAVFIDLENAGCKSAALEHIIEKVKIRGDIYLGRVYGYTEHYAELNPVLLSNTFSAVPSIRYGGRQKNNLDIQLVIDALEVAYTNPHIDCVCIVSGDSDYTPLVGKLKSMGKLVLGISRSECASEIFIKACNEFIFLESVRGAGQRKPVRGKKAKDQGALEDLAHQIEEIIGEQADPEGWLLASTLKDTLLRLRPDFTEKTYGANTFGKLLALVEKMGCIRMMEEGYNLKVRLGSAENGAEAPAPAISKEAFQAQAKAVLVSIREDGFERVNPSVIKAALTAAFPAFEEKALGFKRFSDLLKSLEKDGIVAIEMGTDGDMLVRIL
ncbi:MAG: NYN domain-containing protein [Clostridia bacterium]|nr:NYN domain-containing protein [Clostridia bacterium]